MSARKILVVSGDYELIHQAGRALSDLGYSFQGAYSFRDAQSAVKHGEFDALLVNGAMHDRYTGEWVVQYLSQHCHDTPLIVYAPDYEGHPIFQSSEAVHRLSSLDDQMLRHLVLKTVHQFTAPLRNTRVLRGRDDSESWDVEEVQTLLALTRSLTEVLDLNEVLNRVVEAARELTGADEGMILLPDGDSDDLYLRARVGMDIREPRNFRIRTSDSTAGQVYQSGHPILIGARGPQKVKTEYFVNALLYVPILFEGQPIGVLGVNNRLKQDVFNSHHEALLLNLAAYAAIAIENARVHEQSVSRARELSALLETSQAINASLSLDYTLKTICQQIVLALGVHQVEVLEWDRVRHALVPLARVYQTLWQSEQEPLLKFVDYPLFLSAFHENQSIAIRLDKTQALEENRYLRRACARAMMIIPIMAEEQPFGALFVFYANMPPGFPQVEQTQQAQYIAMEMLLEYLGKSGRKMTRQLSELAVKLNETCGADWYELSMVTPELDALRQHLIIGGATWRGKSNPLLSLSHYPDLVDALETQTLLNQHIDGDLLTPGGHALLDIARGRALLGLPLVYGGQTQAFVVCVDSASGRAFTPREVSLARAVVGQAASALENARLMHDLGVSLTQLQQAQERLIKAERLSAMGELAAAVAHQINNPLTTIVVDTELMMLDLLPGTGQYETLESIKRAGKRAAAVVRRLLAAVHPQGEHVPPASVNAITTIEDTLSLVKSHIERDGIRIVTHLSHRDVHVVAMPGELEDVWLNLLMNAHDALVGRPKPSIQINAELCSDEECLRVVVADNGSGIPEAIIQQVFDPFFTTKPIGEGTGLGLHICRQVVERVGGQITVHSKPNQGTQFTVVLPVHKGD
jgi:signal transduction histidine kinase